MEIDLPPEQKRFRDELRDYLAAMMTDALRAELGSDWEGGGPEFRKAMKQMGRDGLLGLSWPKEYGGQERSAVEQFLFADEVQAVGFPLPFLTLNTVGPVLHEHGSEAQRKSFCPRILAGEVFFAIGYSARSCGEMSSTSRPWSRISTRLRMRRSSGRSWLTTRMVISVIWAP